MPREPYRSAGGVLRVGDVVHRSKRPVQMQLVLVQLQVEDGHHEHQVDHEEEEADPGAQLLQLGGDASLASQSQVGHHRHPISYSQVHARCEARRKDIMCSMFPLIVALPQPQLFTFPTRDFNREQDSKLKKMICCS